MLKISIFILLISSSFTRNLLEDFKLPSLNLKPSFPKENNVLILTNRTLSEAISTYENLLIICYSPWCPHCKKVMPKLEKASLKLKERNLDVKIAKIDASYYTLPKNMSIGAYPTFFYIQNGKKIKDYKDNRSTHSIVNWFIKYLISPLKELNSADEIDQFINFDLKHNKLIFFGSDENQIKLINEYSSKDYDHLYGLVQNQLLIKQYEVKSNTLRLFKNFDEKFADFEGDLTEDDKIKQFVVKHNLPLIITDVKKGIRKTNRVIPQLYINRNKEMPDIKGFEESLITLAKKNQGKIQFIESDFEDHEHILKVLNMTKLAKYELPQFTIIDYSKGMNLIPFKKYFNEYHFSNLKQFLENWINGMYRPEVKSEEIPKQQNGPIFKVVAKSFRNEVINNNLDVFVKFYSPYCGHCRKMANDYMKLAKNFEKFKDNIRIAEFDMTENDMDDYPIRGYPTLLFWRNGEKEKPVSYAGNRTTDDMSNFILENMSKKDMKEAIIQHLGECKKNIDINKKDDL